MKLTAGTFTCASVNKRIAQADKGSCLSHDSLSGMSGPGSETGQSGVDIQGDACGLVVNVHLDIVSLIRLCLITSLHSRNICNIHLLTLTSAHSY